MGSTDADGRTVPEQLAEELAGLTYHQRRLLSEAGFRRRQLRRLADTPAGAAMVRSVLLCFTDTRPGVRPGREDIARADSARRAVSARRAADSRAGIRSAVRFADALDARGITSLPPGSTHRGPSRRTTAARPGPTGALRSRSAAAVPAWGVILLVAIATTTGLAALDLGFGAVLGAVALIACYVLLLRRTVYLKAGPPRTVRRLYLAGSLLLVAGSFWAAQACMLVLGSQGRGSIDSQELETGSHGTSYYQCSVLTPDGDIEELRFAGPCPAPDGTPETMVYVPGDGPLRPLLGDKAQLEAPTAVWCAANLLGLGSLVGAAALTVRDTRRPGSSAPS